MSCLVGYDSYSFTLAGSTAGAGVFLIDSFKFPSQQQVLVTGIAPIMTLASNETDFDGVLVRVEGRNQNAVGSQLAFPTNDVAFMLSFNRGTAVPAAAYFASLQTQFFQIDHGMMVNAEQQLSFYFIASGAVAAQSGYVTIYSRPANAQGPVIT